MDIFGEKDWILDKATQSLAEVDGRLSDILSGSNQDLAL